MLKEANLADELARSSEQFKDHFESTSFIPRMTLIVAALLLIGATPFYDSPLMQVPDQFREFSRWMQFGVQIPPILLALLCTCDPGRPPSWYLPPWPRPPVYVPSTWLHHGTDSTCHMIFQSWPWGAHACWDACACRSICRGQVWQ